MTPYLQDPDVTLYHGDVLDVLRELPDESVDCAATSPPFYGLRDYGVDGQIGLESTPELWRDRLVEVFRELRRVLVPTGTLWVECGDSYASHPNGNTKPRSEHGDGAGKFHIGGSAQDVHYASARGQKFTERLPGLKPKDLIGAPFLLAFGLRDDGWWWRSTNIWHKPNCLPESVTDRPVVSHSYVFQFSKKARYFHDAEGVREPLMQSSIERGYTAGSLANKAKPTAKSERNPDRGNGFWKDATMPSARSLRSVWTFPTEGFPEAHFATWPTKLAERILLMACPEMVHGGCGGEDAPCGPDTCRPGIVLDPFVGSGTTCLVARKLCRRSIGIDLSANYLDLAARRLQQQSLFALDTGAVVS